MARPRQPVDLIAYKGKKHLTKEEIEQRKATEVKAKSDKIKAPSYLPQELKKEFKEIADELIEIGIMSNLDIDALSRFLIAKKLYIGLSQELLNDPSQIIRDKDILGSQDKLFKQCRAAAMDLGLTISSRCKLVVPKKEEKKELTEEEKLFGGRV